MATTLYIIRVTTVDDRSIASVYASTVAELQNKFDAWKASANGRAYGNQKIVAFKYVNDKKVSERLMQVA